MKYKSLLICYLQCSMTFIHNTCIDLNKWMNSVGVPNLDILFEDLWTFVVQKIVKCLMKYTKYLKNFKTTCAKPARGMLIVTVNSAEILLLSQWIHQDHQISTLYECGYSMIEDMGSVCVCCLLYTSRCV